MLTWFQVNCLPVMKDATSDSNRFALQSNNHESKRSTAEDLLRKAFKKPGKIILINIIVKLFSSIHMMLFF